MKRVIDYISVIIALLLIILSCDNSDDEKQKESSIQAVTLSAVKGPYLFATLSGQLMTMKFLIEECNANIEAANEEGFTPLLIAADNGYLYVIKYLILERKANFKALTKNGYSIIDIILFKKKKIYINIL